MLVYSYREFNWFNCKEPYLKTVIYLPVFALEVAQVTEVNFIENIALQIQ